MIDLNKQRETLVTMRKENLDLLISTRTRGKSEEQNDDSPVTSDIPTHPADAASVTYERESDMAFEREYQDIIDQIDLALAKLEAGTYTKCSTCGKEIGEERLEAQPYATLCIEDQELSDVI